MNNSVAEIDLKAIEYNFKNITNKVKPAKIMAIVKANAYGHGAVPVSRSLIKAGAHYLGVAFIEEGIELRQNNIKAPILVLTGLNSDNQAHFIEHDLEATVYSSDHLKSLAKVAEKYNKPAKVQIKIDTGMGRIGVDWMHAVKFIEQTLNHKNIKVNGIFTHFATSDELDKSFTYLQLHRFNKIITELKSKNINIPSIHAANSGAILDIPDSYLNMVRPGISLYGHFPSQHVMKTIDLKPAMTLKTHILHIKKIQKGTSVSYGRSFIAEHTTKIATIPIGYADGYNRLLSNNANVLIKGKLYPVVGKVCMDLTMIDIGNDELCIGDQVVLFGRQKNKTISVLNISETLDTIPYEAFCWISKRVKRIYNQ